MTAAPAPARGAISVELEVNGRLVRVVVDPMRRLSDVLRDDLGLTGTKVGCEAGDCGACTIRLDGRQADACLVPAAQADGGAHDHCAVSAVNAIDGRCIAKCGNLRFKKVTHQQTFVDTMNELRADEC